MTSFPEEQFVALVRPLLPQIRRHLLVLTRGHHDDTEDLQQEVLIALHRELPRFRHESALSTFVWRVTHNVAVGHLRSWARRRRREERHALGEFALQPQFDPTEALERGDRSARILAALSRLEERERSLVYLKEIEGVPLQELATVFGVPLGTIKSRLSRAKDKLAHELRQEGIDA
jgi:RNA polymerase sigma-70 factor (ECF subfamily)